MDRIAPIKEFVAQILPYLTPERAQSETQHTFGCAESAALIAKRRGLDPELAYIAGLLHDLYAYRMRNYLLHAQSAAEMARPILRDLGLFSDEEQTIILSAIYRHANKELVNGPYDEVLKDADTLQPYLSGAALSKTPSYRMVKLMDEFGIPHDFELPPAPGPGRAAPFDRAAFADLAESLAKQAICGKADDEAFAEIIHYFPEDDAFDTLVSAWCAAFVYHCGMKTGLHLPLRQPPASCRFASVRAWAEWGDANGFVLAPTATPERGDLVIFHRLLSNQEYDHIGIVLSADGNTIAVAEGNAENRNVSAIVSHNTAHVACYLHIPNGYSYDGWKFDYKLPQ